MGEVLTVRRKDISGEFMRGFARMTDAPISLDELLGCWGSTTILPFIIYAGAYNSQYTDSSIFLIYTQLRILTNYTRSRMIAKWTL
jgi:hypothetical protein